MPARFTRRTLATLTLVALPAAAPAQHGGGGDRPVPTPPREATQFDFLVGQWEVVVRPAMPTLLARLHGLPQLGGTWKAWRALDGWGVEDELRITDADGNPRSLSHAVRFYDAGARHWQTSMLDVYRGVFTTSTAEWRGSEMTATARGTDGEGRPSVVRTRYYDITPTSFKFQQDRSLDGGHTWTEGVLRIEARRVAAAATR